MEFRPGKVEAGESETQGHQAGKDHKPIKMAQPVKAPVPRLANGCQAGSLLTQICAS